MVGFVVNDSGVVVAPAFVVSPADGAAVAVVVSTGTVVSPGASEESPSPQAVKLKAATNTAAARLRAGRRLS
ncbi:hypothetical protein B841_00580 [Corynebacterium maris DSM 45190]|uniref:Uncharacterized protein n=1 Tax=Corynebacterium maris DSM 45190 TaxID=1224163 RepID=S5SR81_9CORY|nr:hypothetical protein B841_00580 [Corynebacterium maris DSM 45190]